MTDVIIDADIIRLLSEKERHAGAEIERLRGIIAELRDVGVQVADAVYSSPFLEPKTIEKFFAVLRKTAPEVNP